MLTAAQLLLGAAACAAFVFAARRLAPRHELTIYAVGFVAAALSYVAFAAAGDASGAWLAVEFAGLLVFSLAALTRLRRSPLLLASGWAAHALWDSLLHSGASADFVPDWYGIVCAGFDFALADYLTLLSRHAVTSAVTS